MMKKTKILTIANRKGGAGKSTCAAHIAIEATKRNLKTILIDLDPQKTLESWWKKRVDENPYLTDISTPQDIESEMENLNKHDFDLCIIDTPGDTSINAAAGIKVADLVLIPSKPTAPDLQAIGRTIGSIQTAKKEYVFLVTQAISRTKLVPQAIAVLSEFGAVVPSVMINRVAYANAMNAGTSAAEEDKAAKEEIEALWNFIYNKLYGIKDDNTKEKVRFKS
jgi:chromosome partitioning protein